MPGLQWPGVLAKWLTGAAASCKPASTLPPKASTTGSVSAGPSGRRASTWSASIGGGPSRHCIGWRAGSGTKACSSQKRRTSFSVSSPSCFLCFSRAARLPADARSSSCPPTAAAPGRHRARQPTLRQRESGGGAHEDRSRVPPLPPGLPAPALSGWPPGFPGVPSGLGFVPLRPASGGSPFLCVTDSGDTREGGAQEAAATRTRAAGGRGRGQRTRNGGGGQGPEGRGDSASNSLPRCGLHQAFRAFRSSDRRAASSGETPIVRHMEADARSNPDRRQPAASAAVKFHWCHRRASGGSKPASAHR
jgi:hypothetical protein